MIELNRYIMSNLQSVWILEYHFVFGVRGELAYNRGIFLIDFSFARCYTVHYILSRAAKFVIPSLTQFCAIK